MINDAPLVLPADKGTHGAQRVQRCAQRFSELGVALHEGKPIISERARFENHRIRHTDLPEVMEISPTMQRHEIL